MSTFRTTTLIPLGAALALGLALTGCSEPEDSSGPGSDISSEATTAAEETTAAETAEETTAEETTEETGGDAVDDVTASGLAAIATAEGETGGTAFSIDRDDDDGTWDIEVRTGDTAVELQISEDGSTVLECEDDDLDGEDRAALDAATVTLAEAIDIAVAETGGVLDDADIDDEAPVHYEVSVDTADEDDVDVDVDATTGEVLRVN